MASAAYPGDFENFKVVSEEVVHERYLTLYNRHVQFPKESKQKGQVFEYDIIGHPQSQFHFAVSFPFHPARDGGPAEVTIIKEYCQGPNCMMFNLPTGGYDPEKHSSYQDCALMELSEEAALVGGTSICLTAEGHEGMCEVKWCANRFTPFLVIDPVRDADPSPQDAQEVIQVMRVDIPRLRSILKSGDMLLPAITTCYMALERLEGMGYSLK